MAAIKASHDDVFYPLLTQYALAVRVCIVCYYKPLHRRAASTPASTMERFGIVGDYPSTLSADMDRINAFDTVTTAKMTAYHASALETSEINCNTAMADFPRITTAENLAEKHIPRFYPYFNGYLGAGRRHTTRAHWEAFARRAMRTRFSVVARKLLPTRGSVSMAGT